MIPSTHERGYFNKKVERKASELKGKKALYSTCYYDEQSFWSIYNKARYDELKRKYGATIEDAVDTLEYLTCTIGPSWRTNSIQ